MPPPASEQQHPFPLALSPLTVTWSAAHDHPGVTETPAESVRAQPNACCCSQHRDKKNTARQYAPPHQQSTTRWKQKDKPGAKGMLDTGSAHCCSTHSDLHSAAAHPPHCCLGAATASPQLLPTHRGHPHTASAQHAHAVQAAACCHDITPHHCCCSSFGHRFDHIGHS